MEIIKLKVIILANELMDSPQLWIKVCNEFSNEVEYRIVDLTKNTWLDKIQSQPFDILLAIPGGLTIPFKQLYDERIYILNKVLLYQVYPSASEIFIYENKRFLSFWLQANNIPHPKTDVFYFKNEAIEYIKNAQFPIVGKVNIGASGSGVTILKCITDGRDYINQTFSGKGAPRRIGPNLVKGKLIKRGFQYILNPSSIFSKIKEYTDLAHDRQKGFVFFQEYIRHEFEWRVVRIGDSFFAHKKLVYGEKASGGLKKSYENPPLSLLDIVKDITDKHSFYSQAVDIFETSDRGYLVNEMQCIFGQNDPYQMFVDGKPGRYIKKDDHWQFEEGHFNNHESFELRIRYLLDLFKLQQ